MKSLSSTTSELSPSCPQPWRSFGVALLLIVAAFAGAAVGAIALRAWIVPTIGLGGVQRIIELGRILDDGWDDEHMGIVLGNSVSVEGYDASIIEVAAPPGWRAMNMAINGCDVMELHVLLPRVLEAQPSAIILTLRAVDLGLPPDLPVDKAYAYALGNFLDAHRKPIDRRALGMNRDSYNALHAHHAKAMLHFRTAVARWVNDQVRGWIRHDMREPDSAEIIAPYNLLASIRGQRLVRHLNTIAEMQDERLAAGDGARLIERLVEQIADAGVIPILVAAPQHPRLRDRDPERDEHCRTFLRVLAAQHNGEFIDATEALDEDGFADAIHPNESGRRILSMLVGRHLPPRQRGD